MKKMFQSKILQQALVPGLVLFAALSGQNTIAQQGPKPVWSDLNDQVIGQYNVKGRTRTDIPDTKISSNLEAGKVTNISTLPSMELAGVWEEVLNTTHPGPWPRPVRADVVSLNAHSALLLRHNERRHR